VAEQTLIIRAVDKVSKTLGNIDKRLGGLNKNVKNLDRGFGGLATKVAAVGAAIGTAFGIKKILQVSSEVEQLGLRFQFLFRSVDEGNKAFDVLLDYASKVPFTLQQIQAGAGNLAVISKDAEELGKNLGIVGNVAAVTGIDFQTASEQIQRSFSGGIAAAEIFRERGVRALLGFQNGATVTAEETKKRFEEVFGPDGPFGNATLVLANSFDGILSMIQDKLFKFQLALGRQGGLFDFAKAALKTLDDELNKFEGGLTGFAQTVGQKIIEITLVALRGTADIIDFVVPVFSLVAKAMGGLFDFIGALPSGIRELGIIGFFLLGPKGKLIALVFGAVFDTIRAGLGYLLQGFAKLQQGFTWILDKLGLLNDDHLANMNKNLDEAFALADRLKTPLSKLNAEADKQPETWGKARTILEEYLAKMEQAGLTLKQQKSEMDKLIEATGSKNIEEATFKTTVDKALEGIVKQKQKIQGMTVAQEVAVELEKMKFSELEKQADKLVKAGKLTRELADTELQRVKDAVKLNVELDRQLKKEQELEKLKKDIEGAVGGLGVKGLERFDPELIRQQEQIELIKEGIKIKKLTEEEGARAIEKIKLDSHRRQLANEKANIQKNIQLIKSGQFEAQDFENMTQKERIGTAVGFSKEMLGVVAQQNEKAFKLMKALAVAEALVNAKASVIAAYKFGSMFGGPIGGAIMAGLAIAATAAQIQAIRAQKYTGPREKGGPVGANQSFLVGEGGPEILQMGPNAGRIINNDDAFGNQGVNVNFNITTTDARGFDELLVERRSTIVGIINQAMNTRGRTGVTA
jgi:hypothetical protein